MEGRGALEDFVAWYHQREQIQEIAEAIPRVLWRESLV
jgi:hypothetical protein